MDICLYRQLFFGSRPRFGPVVAQSSYVVLRTVREPLRECRELQVKKKVSESITAISVDLVVW